MKKLILLILIIAGVYFYFSQNKTEVNQATNTGATNFEPSPSSATFIFDNGPITLSNGQGEGDEETVVLLELSTSGDINEDDQEDTVVLLASSGGGSGVFIYIAAYVSGPVSYKGSNAIFIGDRISPKSVSISNGVVTLKYLDRKPDEPFAAEPTVSVSKQFVYLNGSLEAR